MKNIKIKTSWTKVDREEDGSLTESCKKYIYMDIDVIGATENEAELILNKLIDTINKNYYCDRAGCIGTEENKKGQLIYSDMLFFNREIGNVTQQKKGLMVLINSLKKEVIKEVLKEQEEQEQEEQEEQEEENTNMKNIKIKKTNRGYYTVIADTQKFGTNEILFEGRNIEECKNYIKRTLILILKVQLQNNKAQEAENTIKILISYLNDEKQKTINNNIAKSWELFSTGAINMEISETEKGYYFVGEQAPVKFTFFIDKEGKDTRKQKNDKVVNTLTDDFVVEF